MDRYKLKENSEVNVTEHVVLSKFEGDPVPENEIERVHITNGTIVAVETIENGQVVDKKTVEGGGL